MSTFFRQIRTFLFVFRIAGKDKLKSKHCVLKTSIILKLANFKLI